MMKTSFLALSVVLIGFSSCKKDRTCTCSQNGTELGKAEYISVTRSEAKKACSSLEAQYSINSPGTTCSLR